MVVPLGRVDLDKAFALEIPVDETLLVVEVSPKAEDTFTLPPVKEVAVVTVVDPRLAVLATVLE